MACNEFVFVFVFVFGHVFVFAEVGISLAGCTLMSNGLQGGWGNTPLASAVPILSLYFVFYK